MSKAKIDPLDPAKWFDRLGRLDRDASGGLPPDRVIRIAYDLVRLAPLPMRAVLSSPLDEDDLEAILACNAYESAALHLIGPKFAFQVQKTTGEIVFHASVQLDPSFDAGHGASPDCASAMLIAWVRCLANLQRKHDFSRLDRSKSQSGPPRQSTEH